jgi:hypothetical protein
LFGDSGTKYVLEVLPPVLVPTVGASPEQPAREGSVPGVVRATALAHAKVPGTSEDLAHVPVLEPASAPPPQPLSRDLSYSGSTCTSTAQQQQPGKQHESFWQEPAALLLPTRRRGQAARICTHTAWPDAAMAQSAASGRALQAH